MLDGLLLQTFFVFITFAVLVALLLLAFLLIGVLVVHTIIEVLIIELLIIPVKLTDARMEPNHDVFILHEALGHLLNFDGGHFLACVRTLSLARLPRLPSWLAGRGGGKCPLADTPIWQYIFRSLLVQMRQDVFVSCRT